MTWFYMIQNMAVGKSFFTDVVGNVPNISPLLFVGKAIEGMGRWGLVPGVDFKQTEQFAPKFRMDAFILSQWYIGLT